jgi:hypothetical protein
VQRFFKTEIDARETREIGHNGWEFFVPCEVKTLLRDFVYLKYNHRAILLEIKPINY